MLALVAPCAAQEAFVLGPAGKGQGYVFRYGNACWLVTAAHLFEGADESWTDFHLSMPGTPALTGYGVAVTPFWPGFDVAVGVVRGEAGQACTARFEDVDVAWTNATPAGRLQLPFVHEDGTVERSAMRITDVPDHKSFLAEFSDGARAFDGRSGSFLASSGRLAGMVITKPETDAAGHTLTNAHGLIRIEEIAMNLKRYLKARGVDLAAAAAPVRAQQQADFAIEVQSSTLEPAGLRTSPENVLIDGMPFLFRGTGRIILRVADGSLQEIRGVRISSSGPEASPKAISIDIDTNTQGPFIPKWFYSGTMDETGTFDTGARAPRQMRRVAISISSAWGGDPRRIDEIVLY